MNIEKNEVTAFIGPSGCGKSTFLRTLNRMNDLIDNVKIEGTVEVDGEDIYKNSDDNYYAHRLFKVNHTVIDMEEELLAIVDNGGRIQNIMIDHPVYGEIQTLLKLTCRRDVRHFLEQAASSDFRPLSELTNGVHYHLVEADSQQDLDYIEEALDNLGFLVKD